MRYLYNSMFYTYIYNVVMANAYFSSVESTVEQFCVYKK